MDVHISIQTVFLNLLHQTIFAGYWRFFTPKVEFYGKIVSLKCKIVSYFLSKNFYILSLSIIDINFQHNINFQHKNAALRSPLLAHARQTPPSLYKILDLPPTLQPTNFFCASAAYGDNDTRDDDVQMMRVMMIIWMK